jgi:hypothetical protein
VLPPHPTIPTNVPKTKRRNSHHQRDRLLEEKWTVKMIKRRLMKRSNVKKSANGTTLLCHEKFHLNELVMNAKNLPKSYAIKSPQLSMLLSMTRKRSATDAMLVKNGVLMIGIVDVMTHPKNVVHAAEIPPTVHRDENVMIRMNEVIRDVKICRTNEPVESLRKVRRIVAQAAIDVIQMTDNHRIVIAGKNLQWKSSRNPTRIKLYLITQSIPYYIVFKNDWNNKYFEC